MWTLVIYMMLSPDNAGFPHTEVVTELTRERCEAVGTEFVNHYRKENVVYWCKEGKPIDNKIALEKRT